MQSVFTIIIKVLEARPINDFMPTRRQHQLGHIISNDQSAVWKVGKLHLLDTTWKFEAFKD